MARIRGSVSERRHAYGRHRAELQDLGWQVYVGTLADLKQRRFDEDRVRIAQNYVHSADDVLNEAQDCSSLWLARRYLEIASRLLARGE